MKKLFSLLVLSFLVHGAIAQATTTINPNKNITDSFRIVKAGCGECRFGMKGNGCQLAVRINGKPYFVDGTNIDEHGDAHANDGLCNKIRKASVSGKLENDRYVATSFRLLKEGKTKH